MIKGHTTIVNFAIESCAGDWQSRKKPGGARRTAGNDERIGKLEAVDLDAQVWTAGHRTVHLRVRRVDAPCS